MVQPEELLRQGELPQCLEALQSRVRNNPADHKQRVFLFQLLAVMGQWQRASDQLEVAVEMNPANLLMAQVCRQALLCERLRAQVFAGAHSPLLLGEPQPWVGMMVQACAMAAQGRADAADELRAQALDQAEPTAGRIDTGKQKKESSAVFEWIADADPRLGPMIEAIIDGKYYWVPWNRISQLTVDPPADLRDFVWAPARIWLTSGADKPALIPTRYPGSDDAANDPSVRLARATTFTDRAGRDIPFPLGQRMFATDAGEFGLLDTRCIRIGDGPDLAPTAQMTDEQAALASQFSAQLLSGPPGGGAADA